MDRTIPRRLDKFLADARVGTRVRIEALAAQGAVDFNGKIEPDLRRLVDPRSDVVEVNGRAALLSSPQRYVLLHKPAGILTTLADPKGRRCVADLVPTDWHGRVGVVGRLDKPTTGALLLTDDGDLSHLLTDPAFHVFKRYLLTVVGEPAEDDPRLVRMREGVDIGQATTQPARCGVVLGSVRPGRHGTQLSEVWLEIREGRFRQVRRMANTVKLKLARLHREAIGPLRLGDLAEGSWRLLERAEVDSLYTSAGGRDAPTVGARRALARRLADGQLCPEDAARAARYFGGIY